MHVVIQVLCEIVVKALTVFRFDEWILSHLVVRKGCDVFAKSESFRLMSF